MGFGIPSDSSNSNTGMSDDDATAGFGLTGAAMKTCVGVVEANATQLKIVKGVWMFLEFTVCDPEFAGEQYSLGAKKITPDMRGNELKKAKRAWMRLGQALRNCGIATGPDQLPLDGINAVANEQPACRLAVSTYDKAGEDVPTIVWGRPKLRQRNGVEVGFDPELANDMGKFRDYGCGVLPAED